MRPISLRYHSLGVFIVLTTVFKSGRSQSTEGGILFPQDSETRERKSLDGIWNFRIVPRNDPELAFREEWYSQPLDQVRLQVLYELFYKSWCP